MHSAARLIEGGLPTDATVAQVLVSKYADHLPLYRQAQILARQGVNIDRSTLADWVGRAAFLLRPVHARLLAILKTSPKLFADETTAPVLDPGRGRTKTGQLWAYARDDRPWGGTDPPAVAYVYAPDRTAARPIAHLAGFEGVLQVDGYAGYKVLADRGEVRLAFCWAHVRRRFYELAQGGPAPIATEVLARIAALYKIESEIRGRSAQERRIARQARSMPVVEALEPWLREKFGLVSQKSKLAEAIRYALSRWAGLRVLIEDGRVEIDSNAVPGIKVTDDDARDVLDAQELVSLEPHLAVDHIVVLVDESRNAVARGLDRSGDTLDMPLLELSDLAFRRDEVGDVAGDEQQLWTQVVPLRQIRRIGEPSLYASPFPAAAGSDPRSLAGFLIRSGLMRSTRKGFARCATAPASPLR